MNYLMVRRALICCGVLSLAFNAAAQEQEAPTAPDRAAIAQCLQANDAAPEQCIGSLYTPCTGKPDGGKTYGMGVCARRELLVWEDIINESLKNLIAGPLGATQAEPYNRPAENKREHAVPGRDIIEDMERSWVIVRAKICDTEAMQYEGGSLSRVVYGQCLYRETARHALWLRALLQDLQSH